MRKRKTVNRGSRLFPSTDTDTQEVLTLYLERLPSAARPWESSRTLGSLQEGQGGEAFREENIKKIACNRLCVQGKEYQMEPGKEGQ